MISVVFPPSNKGNPMHESANGKFAPLTESGAANGESSRAVARRGRQDITTETFIRISVYPYIMTKQKITISLDTEIAKALRTRSIEKYGDSRSMSRLIEDLATGAAEAEQPDACKVLGFRSQKSHELEAGFKSVVEKITKQLDAIKVIENVHGMDMPVMGAEWYFAFKEACELRLNRLNEITCWSCTNIDKSLIPMYPTAGKNFVEWSKVDSSIR